MKKKEKEKDYLTTKSPSVKLTYLLYTKYPAFSRRIE